MTDQNEYPKDVTVEYPDYAGYPDGEGIVGNGPTTDAPPSGVDPSVADEPETEETLEGDVPTDEDDTEVNDG
ncbi:hypothetical protein C5B96_03455 [Subtercola sp. Z020]|uniref:hypothetical protein n=1 Tax=Subtercola sp. Z020 TaxID=2080582 RepID=UPI000CE89050|nr:hypothetical protein [Subtercola sp. Z020]PPF87852.1 hypothetical protein C5B96_03455 [Subtercola sp. Z020]